MISDVFSILGFLAAVGALVVSFQVLNRVRKVERQLEIPAVKKVSPELKLKMHKKANLYNGQAKIEEVGESDSNGRNNRRGQNGQGQKSQQQNQSKPVAAPVAAAPASQQAPKAEAADAKDKDGRRRRRGNRPRYEASSEILSNQEGVEQEQAAETQVSAQPAVEIKSVEVAVEAPTPVRDEAPAQNGRPALAPRGQRNDAEVAAAPVQTEDTSGVHVVPNTLEPSAIRYGRRNLIKRNPALEED